MNESNEMVGGACERELWRVSSRLGDLAGEIMVRSGERIPIGLEGETGNPIRMGATEYR